MHAERYVGVYNYSRTRLFSPSSPGESFFWLFSTSAFQLKTTATVPLRGLAIRSCVRYDQIECASKAIGIFVKGVSIGGCLQHGQADKRSPKGVAC